MLTVSCKILVNGSDQVTYEELLIQSDQENLIVKEKNIPGYRGRIFHDKIAIHKGISSQIEKACVLAEELGHHHTSSGNILDQTDTNNRKQELRARMWAYNELIGLRGITKAYEHGCSSIFDMAEYLEVTEEYLKEALNAYRNKYGICADIDNYTICFIPYLAVFKKV